MSLPRNKQLQNNFSFFAAVYLLFSDVNATKDDDNDTVPPQLMSSDTNLHYSSCKYGGI